MNKLFIVYCVSRAQLRLRLRHSELSAERCADEPHAYVCCLFCSLLRLSPFARRSQILPYHACRKEQRVQRHHRSQVCACFSSFFLSGAGVSSLVSRLNLQLQRGEGLPVAIATSPWIFVGSGLKHYADYAYRIRTSTTWASGASRRS